MNSITINARVAFAGWKGGDPRPGFAAATFRDEVHAVCKADGVPIHTGPLEVLVVFGGQDSRLSLLDMSAATLRALEGALYVERSIVVGVSMRRINTTEPTVGVEWRPIEDGNEKSV